ncbi:MAG: Lar family restriction alleviation protein [Ramlibacter sp.]|nr:Lar family restriction alleviation protein [Ramlibacter sp.]
MANEQTSEVKACPFCGSVNVSSGEVFGERPDGQMYKQTACMDCFACGPEVLIDRETIGPDGDDLADAAWNRRALSA